MNNLVLTPTTALIYLSMTNFVKERQFRAVTPAQHLIALFLHVNGTLLAMTFLVWFLGFWISTYPASLRWEDLAMECLIELMAMRAMMLGYQLVVTTCYWFTGLDNATMHASFSMALCFVFSGFLIPISQFPSFLVFFPYISPYYWAFTAVLKIRLRALLSRVDQRLRRL